MFRIALVVSILALSAFSVFADDGEPTSEDIINEIQGGRTKYTPNHFIFNFKPISFILGQNFGKVAPFPFKYLQVKARLIGELGVQAEPVSIYGGHGGYGFTVGPGYFPRDTWEETHFALKYEMDYINRKGAYHGLMIEMDRHYLFKFLVLTYGGAVGFGVTGASAAAGSSGEIRILEIEQGIAYDVNLGLGFAL